MSSQTSSCLATDILMSSQTSSCLVTDILMSSQTSSCLVTDILMSSHRHPHFAFSTSEKIISHVLKTSQIVMRFYVCVFRMNCYHEEGGSLLLRSIIIHCRKYTVVVPIRYRRECFKCYAFLLAKLQCSSC
jgi:hypothetical protein